MKGLDKKDNIITHSKELFEKFGYHKTTLTDIAKSIGYVKSAIYYYFSGKEEIFEILVKKEAEGFLNKLVKTVDKVESPAEKLKVYIDTRVNLMEDVSRRYQFLKKDFFELIPLVEKNRKEFDLVEVEYLSQIINNVSIETNKKITNPNFKAKLLMQNIKGLEIQMFVTKEMNAHNENRKAFIDFMLYGVFN